ncbi:MAG: alpha/beta hydrolase [Alphaproteobacteria bacterium]|nr:alpha/beta hydrolase [Alphaproteobacteria bacterium]
MNESVDRPLMLTRDSGATIAYHRLSGKGPGVVFMTGFMSDMTGSKALALEELCKARGQAFLRFDYRGHGASSDSFKNGCIGDWAEDAILALDQLSSGPQVLVGSSMGGWIMLLTALARPLRVAGLVGIAPAPDFTENLIWPELTEAQRQTVTSQGFVEIPSQYGEAPYLITRRLIEDGRSHLLLNKGPLPINVPVRLIQGLEDKDVPWKTALAIQNAVESQDVEITFVKNGGHRLSEPEDLSRLVRTVAALLDQVEV